MTSRASCVLKKIISVIIVLMIASSVFVSAFAAEDVLDVDRTGNFTFKIVSSDSGQHIGGGSVAVYKVADLLKNGEYVLHDEYKTLDVDLDKLKNSDESWQRTDEDIALFI